jgi:two-component system chemotaxis response regulator CheB
MPVSFGGGEMILFCEECGTRHDIKLDAVGDDSYQFVCNVCHEKLIVSFINRKEKSIQAAMQQDRFPDSQAAGKPLKILVVDDSKLIRKALREIIESDGAKQVIGEAENGKIALDLLQKLDPDVITLDINMPVMDGLTTLKHIMINCPRPTVMISALTQEGALETFESLKYGAIDFLPKPKQIKGADIKDQKLEIIRKLEMAACVQMESVRYLRRPSQNKAAGAMHSLACDYVLAIGVTEGGYGALLNFIPRLRLDLPAAYIAVMHQAPEHINAFARYLDQCSQLTVQRAERGINLQAGTCYLAASSEMFGIEKNGSNVCFSNNTVSDFKEKGAINRLMGSVSKTMAKNAAGIILTGAGYDGLEGLGKIINKGGTVFVQDPKSCLFKETPTAAAERFSVDYLVSDKQMAGAISSFLISRNS